jgi:hypothetical protein
MGCENDRRRPVSWFQIGDDDRGGALANRVKKRQKAPRATGVVEIHKF